MSSNTSYRAELRANRHRYFDSHFKKLVARSGIDPQLFSKNLLTEIRNLQNRTRGTLFELMGEVLVQQDVGMAERPFRQKRFQTPSGERHLDLFFEEYKLAVEVKSGQITNRESVRWQIQKDCYLLKEGLVRDMLWVLFRGASRTALDNLERHEIRWIDLRYDVEVDTSTSAEL